MALPRPGPRAAACAAVALTLFALGAFASNADWVEHYYVEGVGVAITTPLIAAFRPVPTSVAEWLEAAAILVAALWLAIAGRRLWVGVGHRTEVALRLGGEAFAAIGSFVTLFYVVWGLAYARPRLEDRMGWEPDETFEVDVFELEALGEVLVKRVNASYLELHLLPDIGHMTGSGFDPVALDASLDEGWARAARSLRLHPSTEAPRGRTKPLISSGLFTWLGIGGFYFPFTGEANINTWAPPWQQPHTRAHEMSHQRFVASENEANFMGFLASVHSDDPLARYSGWLFAQRQVLRALIHLDSESGFERLLMRYPGVQRDVNESRAFWTQYDGPVADMGSAVNDVYLKINQVEGGTQSYSRSLRLIVRWARSCGALPADPHGAVPVTLGSCDPYPELQLEDF